MKKMIINKLYIFSIKEKKAKFVEFSEGKNIVVSSKKKGNDTGKSVLLKSIYHTLGADCFFDDTWDTNEKTYIIDINVDQKKYFIYRKSSLFKIFSETFELIAKTINRGELSEYLEKLFDFAVMLPDRNGGKLEYAPPAYNYLLNFIDQDKMQATNFASFRNLQQYANYKENVLYYQFGILDKEYYELIKRIEKYEDDISEVKTKKEFTSNMLDKILENINEYDYSTTMENLNIEIENSKEEYNSIIEKLHKTKQRLINLKNEKQALLLEINELNISVNHNEREIKSLEEHICPLCKSKLEEEEDILLKKYNTSDDLLLLSDELQISIIDIDNKIKKEEIKYNDFLNILNEYEKKINFNSKEINDIIKYKGFIEVKEELFKELEEYKKEYNNLEKENNELKKKKKEYDDKKIKVNNMYKELMISDKNKFGLEEIKEEKIKNIKGSITASGSNIPITTMIWYFNLLKIKYSFNSETIRFPIVLDSPKNVEMDEEKEQQFFKYIFENADKDSQLIISSLKLDEKVLNEIDYDNIISLSNNRYQLLNEEDYINYKDILLRFSSF